MRIGTIDLENNLILSPMAGFSDFAFRILAKRAGAGLVCTEMVNARALQEENVKSQRIVSSSEEGRPFSVQIFGTDIEDIKKAAQQVEPLTDIISFNCGCPAFRIKKIGCGAAMLDHPEKIVEITKAIRSVVTKPIMMKIRLGNNKPTDYVRLCKEIEKAGADAIIVHGRTAAQGYSGKANWSAIREIKKEVTIPIIANGDVVDGPSAEKCLAETGADGIAIGRAALGDPLVFHRISTYLKTREVIPVPSAQEKVASFIEYLRLASSSGIPWPQILTQAQCFTKGIEGAAKFRLHLNQAKTVEAIEEAMKGLAKV